MGTMRLLFGAVVLVGSLFSARAGVPGSTSTLSGYDTELGKDPVCWVSQSSALLPNETDAMVTPFPNPLVEDFQLSGEVELLLQCPTGINLKAYAPKEFGTPPHYTDGIRPRVKEWYNFTVEFTIDQLGIKGDTLISDNEPTIVAVQTLLCELGKVGFCSPFIHEEANARLAAQGITTPPARGDRHGSTHVHSPYEKIVVDPTVLSQSFNITVPLIINDPGSFYAISALQFYTYDSGQQQGDTPFADYRYDVANALDDMTLLTYYDQPEILTVTDPVKITTYVLIGIACAALGYLLYETIKHRTNNIIRVSQGSFLVVFLLAGIWASVSTFLLEPKNDVYCNLVTPMLLIPLQLMFSITIGRLWRIQAVVSPLLVRKLNQEQNLATRFGKFMTQVTSCGGLVHRQRRGSSMRRSITPLQLARVVALFTMPQVILQIVGYILDPDEAIIQWNEDESVGRTVCASWTEPVKSFRLWSVVLLFLLFVVLLVLSYASRKLPSLLNETSSICNSTIENIVAMVVAFAILILTNSPTSSPDIAYLVICVVVYILTLNSSWRIMFPKLRMVWRGETVVISKLVSDHHRRSAQMSDSIMSNVSGFAPGQPVRHQTSSVNSVGYSASSYGRASSGNFESEGSSNPESDNKSDLKKHSTLVTDTETSGSFRLPSTGPEESSTEKKELVTAVDNAQEDENKTGVTEDDTKHVSFSDTTGPAVSEPMRPPSPRTAEGRIHSSSSLRPEEEPAQASIGLGERRHSVRRHHHTHPIMIADDETPTRRLVLRMVDLQLVLNRVNQRILSGLVVSHEDWKTLQDSSVDLGTLFQDEVKFKWEQDDDLI